MGRGISEREQQFLTNTHAIGLVGVLILRRLKFLGVSNADGLPTCTAPETDLAHHTARSVATIKRYLTRLKALALLDVARQYQGPDGKWLPNCYIILPLGLHLLRQFEHVPGEPWLTLAPQFVSTEEDALCRNCSSAVSYGSQSSHPLGDEESAESHTASQPPQENPLITEEPHEAQPLPVEQLSFPPTPLPPAPALGRDLEPVVQHLEQTDPRRFGSLREWVGAKLRAGIPCHHLVEALAALTANLWNVLSWAGWVQNHLEQLARAEHEASRIRERALENTQRLKQQFGEWEQQRAMHPPGGTSLVELVLKERRLSQLVSSSDTY